MELVNPIRLYYSRSNGARVHRICSCAFDSIANWSSKRMTGAITVVVNEVMASSVDLWAYPTSA